MKINDATRIQISNIVQYIPILSSGLGISDIIMKKVKLVGTTAIENQKKEYDNFVRFKSKKRVFLSLIPVAGNLMLGINDLFKYIFKSKKMGSKYHDCTNVFYEALNKVKDPNLEFRIRTPEWIRKKMNNLKEDEFTIVESEAKGVNVYGSEYIHNFNLIITKEKAEQIKLTEKNVIEIRPWRFYPSSNFDWNEESYETYESFEKYFAARGIDSPKLVK